MGSPGRPIAEGLANSFRYFPQHAIDNVLGPKWGPRVEGWMGMSPAPDATVYDPQGNFQADPADVMKANESFRHAQEQRPNLATMQKPLPKGK